MRTLMALLLAGILIMGMSVPVFAQDEPPSLGVSGVLTDGAALSADLDSDVGMHLYAFEGANGATVTINMTKTDGDIDPFLILLRQDGRVEAWNDDGGNDLNASLQWTLPVGGIYFALATTPYTLYRNSDSDDNTEGTYRIEITGASNAADDLELDPGDLRIPRVNLDSTLQGQLSEQQPVFLAWLNVQDSIVIDLAAPSNQADTLMYVFDVDGQRIAVDDDGGPDGISAFVPELPLTEPGQYLILVTTWGFHEVNERGSQGGTFNLIVNRSS
jgi:hypothetical protein